MIMLMIYNAIYSLIALLTKPIYIPSLPEEVITFADNLAEYISMGIGVLSVYTDLGFIISLFAVVVIVDSATLAYKFVMWIIRKIPLAGID